MRVLPLLLVVVACDRRIEERQQAALDAVADAIPVALVTAELLQHTTAAPDETTAVEGARHDGQCGCPCIGSVGTDDSYVQELDYQQPSCVPESEMLPGRIGGHVWLDYDRGDVSLSRAQAWLAPTDAPEQEEPLDVDLTGTFEGREDLWDATVTGSVAAGPHDADLDLVIDLGRDVAFDGTIAGGVLAGLALPRRDALAPCPIPVEGTFELDGAIVSWVGDTVEVDVDGEVLQRPACDVVQLP